MRPPYARTFHELVAEMAQRAPAAPAVIDRGRVTTYQELAHRAGKVAAALRGLGLARGHRVGVLLDNRIEWLEVVLGASMLGCIAVPLSTWAKRAELEFLLTDADASVLFTLNRYAGQAPGDDIEALRAAQAVPPFQRIVCVGSSELPERTGHGETIWRLYEPFIEGDPLDPLPPGTGASAADTFVILYTSGSSTRPKAVPLDQHAAIENGFNIGERMGLQADDRVLVSVPLFWSYGCVNALAATLSHGACLVLQSRFEPGEALDLIERHRCTALYTLPAMTNALVGHPSFRPERTTSLRTGLTIGSPQDVVKAATVLGASRICNVYGSTETYGNCCVTWSHWPLEQRANGQGPPLPGIYIRILHPEADEWCAPGEVGHVEVSGYLTRGYINASADQNAAAFTADGYFRTGDLGSWTTDGAFVFAGRSSEIIKRSGINVSPAEVEEILQQHEDVGLAGVVGLSDPEKGELIIAHVVLKPGRASSPEALIAHCKAVSSRYKVPDRVEIVASLPLTPTGKLLRRELKALVAGGGATHQPS